MFRINNLNDVICKRTNFFELFLSKRKEVHNPTIETGLKQIQLGLSFSSKTFCICLIANRASRLTYQWCLGIVAGHVYQIETQSLYGYGTCRHGFRSAFSIKMYCQWFSRNCRIFKIVLGGNATSYQDLDDEKKSNSFNKENKSSESAALLWKISSPLLHDLLCKNILDRNTMRSSL